MLGRVDVDRLRALTVGAVAVLPCCTANQILWTAPAHPICGDALGVLGGLPIASK